MRILDRFLPPSIPDRPRALRRGRLLVATAFGLALTVSFGLVVRLMIAGLEPVIIAINIVCIAIFTATPWLLRTTGSLAAAGTLVTGGYYLLIVGPSPFVGGIDGPILMAAPLLPVLATYLVNRRVGILFTVCLLVPIALYALLPRWGLEIPPSALTADRELLARAVILGLAVGFAAVIAAFAERQRVDTEHQLRSSQKLYRRTFEQSKDAVVLTTAEGQLIDVNLAGLELFGLKSKEALQAYNAGDSYVDPGERRLLLERLEAEGFVQDYETRHRTRSGEVRVLQGTTSTIRDEDGNVQMLLAILRDVTDKRHAEAEREAMLAELAAKNADLQQFTYSVSHDLKGPLGTIRGFLGLMEKDAAAGNTEQVANHYATIDRAARTMTRMLDDLLDLSQIGSREVSCSEVDSGDNARQAALLLAGRVRDTGAEVKIAEGMPVIHTDPALLETMFLNLVDNAVKFSAEAEPRPTVRVGVRTNGATAVFTVKDNGRGLRPNYEAKIFEPFQQLDPDAPGTGIGLAQVRRCAEALGGRVWVESEGEGEGCTFCFTV